MLEVTRDDGVLRHRQQLPQLRHVPLHVWRALPPQAVRTSCVPLLRREVYADVRPPPPEPFAVERKVKTIKTDMDKYLKCRHVRVCKCVQKRVCVRVSAHKELPHTWAGKLSTRANKSVSTNTFSTCSRFLRASFSR